MKGFAFMLLFVIVAVAIPATKNWARHEFVGLCLIVFILVEMIKCSKEDGEK
jgi:hypothetical protein